MTGVKVDRAAYRDILQRTIDRYGRQAQEAQTIEEMAELTQAITHLWRMRGMGQGRPGQTEDECMQQIIEEIADVRINLDELEMIYGCGLLVNNAMLHKVARSAARMDSEEQADATG